ncbi:hypothetical protein L218DRAFT_949989 [Marasmius fiardii PR-910]|nr:hypothetical protein L218DRAFT_949989 [Marasmius fiardii PR-910]
MTLEILKAMSPAAPRVFSTGRTTTEDICESVWLKRCEQEVVKPSYGCSSESSTIIPWYRNHPKLAYSCGRWARLDLDYPEQRSNIGGVKAVEQQVFLRLTNEDEDRGTRQRKPQLGTSNIHDAPCFSFVVQYLCEWSRQKKLLSRGREKITYRQHGFRKHAITTAEIAETAGSASNGQRTLPVFMYRAQTARAALTTRFIDGGNNQTPSGDLCAVEPVSTTDPGLSPDQPIRVLAFLGTIIVLILIIT